MYPLPTAYEFSTIFYPFLLSNCSYIDLKWLGDDLRGYRYQLYKPSCTHHIVAHLIHCKSTAQSQCFLTLLKSFTKVRTLILTSILAAIVFVVMISSESSITETMTPTRGSLCKPCTVGSTGLM